MNRAADRKRLYRNYQRTKGRAWAAAARSHAPRCIAFSACLFLLWGVAAFGQAAVRRHSLSALLLALASSVAACTFGTLASWSRPRREAAQQDASLACVPAVYSSTHSPMHRALYRKKLRLQYLLSKATALVSASAIKLASIAVVVAVAYSLLAYHKLPLGVVILLAPFFFAVPYYLMRDGERVVTDLEAKARNMPYVPPVSLDTLSAAEVLVRGAQEPSAPSETLLRATVKGEETKPEELLRSSTPE